MLRRTCFAVLVATWLTAPADAQCVGPDNLSGPCWAPVIPNLPQFLAFQVPALGVCWDGCTPSAQNDIRVTWSHPQQTSCTQYVSQVDVFDSSGAPLLTGKATMDYTRTWEEVSPSGSQHQVWRFVVKADLSPATAAGTAPMCPVPSCMFPVGPYQTSFFYGYVDFAFDCSNGVFEHSLVLHHACDSFIHRPGLSSRPGTFHPGRSYAIVAPHTSVMPFIPMNLPAPGGPLVAEAVRPVAPTSVAGCVAEDRVQSGALNPFISACMCTLSLVPPQYTLSVFNGNASCVDATGSVSGWQSQAIGFPSPLPWFHLVSASMGCWGNDVRYPGKECAWVNEGLMSYHDTCPATAGDYFEVFYGATTSDGWSIAPSPIGPPLTQRFLDVADNFTNKLGTPAVLPLFGNVMPTDHLIYVNVP